MNRLQNKVKSNWVIPHGQNDKKTIVIFKINREGKILNTNVTEKSGDEEFDQNALAAIYKSVPFENIPENIKDNNISVRFVFNQNLLEAKLISQITSTVDSQKVADNTTTPVQKINTKNNKQSVISGVTLSPDYVNYKKQAETILYYNLPKSLYFKERYLMLRILIGKDGKLISVQKQASSGDNNFDNKIIARLKKASFPQIPDSLNMSEFSLNYTVRLQRRSSVNNNIVYVAQEKPVMSSIRGATSLINLANSIMLFRLLH